MKIVRILEEFLGKISQKDAIDSFNKTVQDFGNSMDIFTKELSLDIEKLNKASKIREEKNKENLDKIWGKEN